MAILDTNDEGATTPEVTLTIERQITVFAHCNGGTHDNHHVALQVSQDGTDWLDLPQSIKGEGLYTYHVSANKARVIVLKAEGATSSLKVHIVAR